MPPNPARRRWQYIPLIVVKDTLHFAHGSGVVRTGGEAMEKNEDSGSQKGSWSTNRLGVDPEKEHDTTHQREVASSLTKKKDDVANINGGQKNK